MLDHILAILLLGVVPARALWRSRTNRLSPQTKTARYLNTIAMVIGLLAILTVDWLARGRTIQMLGLATPTTMRALAGLGFAAAILCSLGFVFRRNSTPGRGDLELARRELLPETPKEVRLFLLLTLAVGIGWEVLYRGFILFYLQSELGLFTSVLVAALAYGAAHGFKSSAQFAGSIAAALAFTIGYAVTWNLWWLILLHLGLPLLSLFASKAKHVSAGK